MSVGYPPKHAEVILEELDRRLLLEAVAEGREHWEDLVWEVRELVKMLRKVDGSRKPAGWAVDDDDDDDDEARWLEAPRRRLAPEEQERAAAFEEYLAYVAAADPRVHRFRQKVLDGRQLTPGEARTFVHSPAAQFFTLGQFRQLNVDVVAHSAKLEWCEDGRLEPRALIRVAPPDIIEQVRIRDLRSVYFYFDRDGRDGVVSVGDRSVLGWLARLGDELTKAYPWKRAEADWFVLTGTIPTVQPVRVWCRKESGTHFSHETIVVEAGWWVRPETVEAVFREARGLRRGNRRIRKIGEKNLKLFRFTTKRSDAVGKLTSGRYSNHDMADLKYEKRPKGQKLVEEWNQSEWVKENPAKRAYKLEDSRLFLRDYQSTRQQIAYVPPFEPDSG